MVSKKFLVIGRVDIFKTGMSKDKEFLGRRVI